MVEDMLRTIGYINIDNKYGIFLDYLVMKKTEYIQLISFVTN